MKSVVLDAYTINPGDLSWEVLESLGEVSVYDRTADKDIIERIGDCDSVFTSKCHITREILDACPGLRFISTLATGYDNIDIKAAAEKGIAVCNIPAYSTEAVTQHTFALLLELCSKVALHKPMFQLSGKSLGIIGYGTIGKRVGQVAEAFGMKVIPYSRNPEEAVKADVVTLHCPATPDNKGFINKEFIDRMKDGAYLINTARGALINEQDLAAAVRSGKLAGAAVDVVSKEPIEADNPLLGVPGLIVTPHMAWTSREAREVVCTTAAANLKAFMEGKELNRIV